MTTPTIPTLHHLISDVIVPNTLLPAPSTGHHRGFNDSRKKTAWLRAGKPIKKFMAN